MEGVFSDFMRTRVKGEIFLILLWKSIRCLLQGCKVVNLMKMWLILQETLQALWYAAFPDSDLDGLISDQWKDMGWQGNDPSTDFRSFLWRLNLFNLCFPIALLGYVMPLFVFQFTEVEDISPLRIFYFLPRDIQYVMNLVFINLLLYVCFLLLSGFSIKFLPIVWVLDIFFLSDPFNSCYTRKEGGGPHGSTLLQLRVWTLRLC